LCEAPEAEAERACEIRKLEREASVTLDVPLVVEIGSGDNWMDAK